MNILVINLGSSTLKFGMYSDTKYEAKGKLTCDLKRTLIIESTVADTMAQIPHTLSQLTRDTNNDAINDNKQSSSELITAVAHRVVHGGTELTEPCLITPAVLAQIEKNIPLAPLHNPVNLEGIRLAMALWPDIPHVAVFDTAFHQSLPAYAYTYAVPKAWRAWGVRRYGFHGTSHQYVMEQVAKTLASAPESLRIISCHLGNGASVCAIDRGRSVDTSMGMSALEGLVMGTRSGDIDPGVYAYLIREKGLCAEEIDHALYTESGLRALSDLDHNLHNIESAAARGNQSAQLALQVFAYRVRKYIGAYAAVMNGCDVLAFTGGIGENSAAMRHRICEGLSFLGLQLDFDKNQTLTLATQPIAANAPGPIAAIHSDTSRIKVMVLETQEAWMIAKITCDLLTQRSAIQDKAPAHASEIVTKKGPTTLATHLTTTETSQSPHSDKPPKTQAKAPCRIPIAVSAHHAHLTQETVEILFGKNYQLTPLKALSQPGYWAATETITVIGPRGKIDHVRILGPCRPKNQIELSQTDTFHIGVDAPLRLSGDLAQTPRVKLQGSIGTLESDGVIVAQRHIHMCPETATSLGIKDKERVSVLLDHSARDLIFNNVIVRVQADAITEMHIDTDEANAADITHAPEEVRTPSGRWARLISLDTRSIESAIHK